MSGILDHLSIGFGVAFSWTNILVAAIGSFFGTMVGVLPGLGPINGVAMLIPIAFAMNLPPETALILLAAVYVGAEYGGRITSILLNVPGEASAIMTTLDGYPLARQGLANVALSLSAWSAFFGAIVSVVGIILLAPLLAKWALAFGPAEYFVLMIFAFCCLTSLLGKQPIKGVLAAMIGLSISVIGVDANSGVYRYTFDSVHLADGIDFVVVVIALFAVSEMLEMLEKVMAGHSVEVKPSGRKLFNLKELAFTWWSVVRSALVGFGVGVLPGAGASVAAAVAYSQEKRIIEAKDPDAKFGKGDMRGLVAPEAAATSSAIGSFVPMLTLGVPGSGTTAVMMGALTLYNITPGPVLFDSKPELVWGLIASLFVANVLLFVMNVPMVRLFSKVLSVPGWLMVPGILCISYIGVYAINAGTFDLLLVAGIGTLGYFLRKFGVPMAPLVLGVVLGDMMEQNLRRALSMTDGNVSVLFASPVAIALWTAAIAVVIVPQLLRRMRKARKAVAEPV
ncbi:tripartite tricarboxylate transporter permease [Achromobacter xylosoxidans]|jgi:putative tricarboxylic transport membrane protein|uniref:Tripartite tricarboxylate transporter permease n=1 Tax=Alcaligenes xylosoxydans xylosoxydans TaxID=85698 RepID=A0A0D6IW36_ALCXX|nr:MULTISPECIES: tripartite tricarboxylate transporter permease [Achromobacter]AHC50511.1 Tricarboxylate transport membrane protein TctA [Achromobacter xylosoxidans NBRC 15126 = ATCC 27061]AMH05542.1 tripartite tricarboxylate transporter TctA [Achromobacter xylosoxidans]AXA74959.1 tripartite tricarboxylate transporter TctA [Achromobacter xylosoxidans]EFV82249.1 membrane protein [Achromobacter xylosoxidans C54]KAA5919714.1 tripartite tricarboxylate transporter permease [Achromobacter xylosoxida